MGFRRSVAPWLLLALPAAHGWTRPHSPPTARALAPGRARPSSSSSSSSSPGRLAAQLQADSEEESSRQAAVRESFDGSITGAATGAKGDEIEKTDGIPNYMLRSSGTIARVVDGEGAVQSEDGVAYESGQLVSLVTSDVIEMVQQQGGAAEAVDTLGENLLVDGFLFDDFMAEDTFTIADPDSAQASILELEIVEARPSSALELGQMGDDDAKKQSVASILGLSTGFAGWTAKVVAGGRVRVGYEIAKRGSDGSWLPSRHGDSTQ